MYREPEIETKEIQFVDENLNYTIEYDMEIHCLQKGNYSSTALDPDEYFGVYKYDLLEIKSVTVYDEETDEDWEVDVDDLPDWIIKMVEDEVDSYN